MRAKSEYQKIEQLYSLIYEANSILVPRRGSEERTKQALPAIQRQLDYYINNGMEGDLELRGSPITKLPDNLTKVGGSLDISKSAIIELPPNLSEIEADLDASYTKLTSLPPKLTQIFGNLLLHKCSNLTSLPPNLQSVDRDLDINFTQITNLPNTLKKVGGRLSATSTLLEELPPNLIVGYDLNLANSKKLTSLPNNLRVGGKLTLHNTSVLDIPEDIIVNGGVDVSNTPFAEHHRYDQKTLKQHYPGVKGYFHF